MMNKQYIIAKSLEEQERILNYLNSSTGFIAVDTETTSLDPFSCKLMGVSISIAETEAFYLPVHNFVDGSLESIDDERLFKLRAGLIEILENKDNKLVMHNSQFDILVLRNTIGANCLPTLYADTMLLKHTVDEQKPHGLKEVATKLFGEESTEEQDRLKISVTSKGGKWNKEQKDIYMADLDILGEYACADADLTMKIFQTLLTELGKQGLDSFFFNEEVMPLNEVVVDDMVGRGIMCDIPYFKNLKENLTSEAIYLEKQAHEELQKDYPKIYEKLETKLLEEEYPLKSRGLLFEQLYIGSGLTLYNDKEGNPTFTKKVVEQAAKDHPDSNLLKWKLGVITDKEFETKESELILSARKHMYLTANASKYVINLASNDQLKYILFTQLGEEPIKVTDKNNAQVDEEVLEHFSKNYSFVAKILQWRKINKLISTYIDGILTTNKNGVVRPGWLQHGTDSGRFSCREPNFQNLPRDDKRIKHGIIAREGYVLIGSDYSQLEPRVFSHYSQEQSLIDAYKRGDDFYGTIGVQVFRSKCSPNELKAKDPQARQNAKEIALGVAYGMMKWKLAAILKCDLNTAQRHIDNYWKSLPNLDLFVRQCHGEAVRQGYVRTQAGRVRRFKDIDKLAKSRIKSDQLIYKKLLNLSINFKIQSTAASIVNRSMVELKKQFKKLGLDAYVLIQIHDEIVVEAREDQAEQVKNLMKEIMENTYPLSVPLLAEPVVAKRLSETK